MPNHASAKKRMRQNKKRNERNKGHNSAMKTAIKNFMSTVEKGEKKAIQEGFKMVQRAISKTASKGVIPAARADRKISRLASHLN